MLTFQEEWCDGSDPDAVAYRVMRENSQIATVTRDLTFRNDRYVFYCADELVEIGQFFETKTPAADHSAGGLEFREVPRRDSLGRATLSYSVVRGNRGVTQLTHGLTFENDRYERYAAAEMVQIGRFVAGKLAERDC